MTEQRKSRFKVGDKVSVQVPPHPVWIGHVTDFRWFPDDPPGSEPLYYVQYGKSEPAPYSGAWLIAAR